jgi:hypothetical protein
MYAVVCEIRRIRYMGSIGVMEWWDGPDATRFLSRLSDLHYSHDILNALSWWNNPILVSVSKPELTGSRSEVAELVVHARLATEDDAVVFAAIRRGVRPSVTKQAPPDPSLQ